MIAPTVLARIDAADETRGVLSWRATPARASGKLAPHRIAPGSITQIARIRSSWKLSDVEIDGLIGQHGSDAPVVHAAQARHAHKPS